MEPTGSPELSWESLLHSLPEKFPLVVECSVSWERNPGGTELRVTSALGCEWVGDRFLKNTQEIRMWTGGDT